MTHSTDVQSPLEEPPERVAAADVWQAEPSRTYDIAGIAVDDSRDGRPLVIVGMAKGCTCYVLDGWSGATLHEISLIAPRNTPYAPLDSSATTTAIAVLPYHHAAVLALRGPTVGYHAVIDTNAGELVSSFGFDTRPCAPDNMGQSFCVIAEDRCLVSVVQCTVTVWSYRTWPTWRVVATATADGVRALHAVTCVWGGASGSSTVIASTADSVVMVWRLEGSVLSPVRFPQPSLRAITTLLTLPPSADDEDDAHATRLCACDSRGKLQLCAPVPPASPVSCGPSMCSSSFVGSVEDLLPTVACCWLPVMDGMPDLMRERRALELDFDTPSADAPRVELHTVAAGYGGQHVVIACRECPRVTLCDTHATDVTNLWLCAEGAQHIATSPQSNMVFSASRYRLVATQLIPPVAFARRPRLQPCIPTALIFHEGLDAWVRRVSWSAVEAGSFVVYYAFADQGSRVCHGSIEYRNFEEVARTAAVQPGGDQHAELSPAPRSDYMCLALQPSSALEWVRLAGLLASASYCLCAVPDVDCCTGNPVHDWVSAWTCADRAAQLAESLDKVSAVSVLARVSLVRAAVLASNPESARCCVYGRRGVVVAPLSSFACLCDAVAADEACGDAWVALAEEHLLALMARTNRTRLCCLGSSRSALQPNASHAAAATPRDVENPLLCAVRAAERSPCSPAAWRVLSLAMEVMSVRSVTLRINGAARVLCQAHALAQYVSLCPHDAAGWVQLALADWPDAFVQMGPRSIDGSPLLYGGGDRDGLAVTERQDCAWRAAELGHASSYCMPLFGSVTTWICSWVPSLRRYCPR